MQALAFFSQRGVTDLTKLKAAKLLFFADKLHLNRYGRPILGDCYFCLDHGPVPSFSLNEMNDALDVNPESRTEEPALLRVLAVSPGKLPVFYLKDASLFDPDVFSQSDLEVLEEVAAIHGKKPAWQLREESHTEPAWKIADTFRTSGSRSQMSYEDFFDPENRDLLALVLENQGAEEELDLVIAKAATNAA